jgi:hypothetical protein
MKKSGAKKAPLFVCSVTCTNIHARITSFLCGIQPNQLPENFLIGGIGCA